MGFMATYGSGAGIKSVKRLGFQINNGATTGSVSLSPSVDPANCILEWGGCYGGNDLPSSMARISLTSTTVDAVRDNSSGILYIWCNVIEFYPGVIKSRQAGTITIGTAAKSAEQSLSPAVVDGKSFVSNMGTTVAAGGSYQDYCKVTLSLTGSSLTDVAANRSNITGFASTVGYQVIEFY